jgi:hypothetical protein
MQPQKLVRASPAQRCGIALILLLLSSVSGLAQVHGPILVSNRTPDLHNLERYVAGIVRPGMTQKERALALWQANSRQMYHWNNPVEFPLIRPGQYNDVTDPIRLMNVYGYTLCFCSAEGMEAVWRQAGLEGRELGLPGHVTNEVWFEGQYHYLDMECKGYFTRPDGVIASARECGLRPAEIIASARLPEGLFPLTRFPFRTYLSRMIFAGIMDDGPSWYASHRAQSGHVMHVSLRPGESYYRSWDNVGKFVNDYKRWMEPGEFGTTDCRYGPHELDGPHSFGNGVMIYEPDLTTATDEFERGVFAATGVMKTPRGLAADVGSTRGDCIFRVELPYVICGRPARIEDPGSSSEGALLILGGTGPIGVEISVDNGLSWKPSGSGPGRIDLTRFVERRYGYQVRLSLAPGSEITDLKMETYFQLSPAALPALAAGDTRMTFELGDRGEMIEWTIPTWEGEDAVAAAAWKLDNVRWTGQWTTAIEPADRKREGSAIFEVKAPPGKVLTRLTADVGGSMNNTGEHVPEDRIDVFGAAGPPVHFRLLGSVQAPPYGEHWTRRVAVSMDFPPERVPAVKKAYLKVRMFQKTRAALSDLRIRYFFEDEKSRLASLDRLVITHGWLEAGQPKSHEKRGVRTGESYTVTTGAQFERPTFVCIEFPGRRSPKRALSDPLGSKTYRPPRASDFPAEAAGNLSNVPILRSLDAEGMSGAKTMAAILLSGSNRTLAGEVRKMLGYRPDESVRSYMVAELAKEPGDHRLRRGLALLDEKRAAGRSEFLRQYIPSLRGDTYGVRFVRRLGWTGSPDDVPPLKHCFGRTGDTVLQLAIAQAAMTLGDRSLARAAALLASMSDPEAASPVDVLLLGVPDHAGAARDRLRRRMTAPADHVRWGVVREMNYLPSPPAIPEAMELLGSALLDGSPQVRLEAVGVLGRIAGGETLLKKALKTETVPFVRDAIVETLERTRRPGM